MNNVGLRVLLIFIGVISAGMVQAQLITSHDALFMPALDQPAQGTAVADPVFGTQIRRLTDAFASGNLGTVPHYSKRQAWNANDSLVLLYNADDGYFDLYDGTTYQFIRPLLDPVVGGEDVFWHPAEKNIIIYPVDSILYRYDLATGERTGLHVFTNYTWINTRGEGNLSADGRYYAFIGQDYNYQSGEVTFEDIVVYDILNDDIVSSMEVSLTPGSGAIDWISISPGGDYVVVDYSDTEQGRYHGVEVYDRNLDFLWNYPAGAGHSDLGYDADGAQILIKDYYDPESNTKTIRKYRLSDGSFTDLLEFSIEFDLHVSLRNFNRPGWCFISTFDDVSRLTDDEASWLPFEDEVFALRTDGSGAVERIAHHHSRRFSPETPDPDNSVYWAEPHATVNKAGTKVIWGSNWRRNMDQVTSVDVYLCDFSQYLSVDDNRSDQMIEFQVYPNPATDYITVIGYEDQAGPIYLEIMAQSGRTVDKQIAGGMNGQIGLTLDVSVLRSGLYTLRLISGTLSGTCKFIKADW